MEWRHLPGSDTFLRECRRSTSTTVQVYGTTMILIGGLVRSTV